MKKFTILAVCLLGNCALFGAHPVKFETQLLAVDANEGVAVADYDKIVNFFIYYFLGLEEFCLWHRI